MFRVHMEVEPTQLKTSNLDHFPNFWVKNKNHLVYHGFFSNCSKWVLEKDDFQIKAMSMLTIFSKVHWLWGCCGGPHQPSKDIPAEIKVYKYLEGAFIEVFLIVSYSPICISDFSRGQRRCREAAKQRDNWMVLLSPQHKLQSCWWSLRCVGDQRHSPGMTFLHGTAQSGFFRLE